MNSRSIAFAFLVAVLVPVLVLGSSQARAGQTGSDHAQLALLLRASQMSHQSKAVYVKNLVPSSLPHATQSFFETIARKQSSIWSDTILENDYRLGSPTQLERVEILYSTYDRQPLAYRISYSARAWSTADCSDPRVLETCEEGRIVGSSFVSMSLQSWMIDEAAAAVFVN